MALKPLLHKVQVITAVWSSCLSKGYSRWRGSTARSYHEFKTGSAQSDLRPADAPSLVSHVWNTCHSLVELFSSLFGWTADFRVENHHVWFYRKFCADTLFQKKSEYKNSLWEISSMKESSICQVNVPQMPLGVPARRCGDQSVQIHWKRRGAATRSALAVSTGS